MKTVGATGELVVAVTMVVVLVAAVVVLDDVIIGSTVLSVTLWLTAGV